MDGVLLDSTLAVDRIWRQWAVDHNLDPESVAAHAHGRRSIETIRQFAPHLDAERENLNVENTEIAAKDGITAIAGAAEFLQRIPQDRFAIVTSATRPLAMARFKYADLYWPKHSVTATDVVHGKPSPEPYLKGAALLGMNPADCLVFEDTPAGIQAGKAATRRVIALASTCPVEDLKAADAVISSFNDIKLEFADETFTVKVE